MNIDYGILLSRTLELCREKGISANKMLQEAGLSKSVIDNIKRQRAPSSEILLTIATYFDVSTDYLLGISERPKAIHDKADDNEGSLEWLRNGLTRSGMLEKGKDLTDEQLTLALKNLDNFVGFMTQQEKSNLP